MPNTFRRTCGSIMNDSERGQQNDNDQNSNTGAQSASFV